MYQLRVKHRRRPTDTWAANNPLLGGPGGVGVGGVFGRGRPDVPLWDEPTHPDQPPQRLPSKARPRRETQTPCRAPPPPTPANCRRKHVPLGSALSPLRWRGKLGRSLVEGVYEHKPWPLCPPPPPLRDAPLRALPPEISRYLRLNSQ